MSQSHSSPINAAPVDATYIVQTANGNLTNEFAMASLATGYVKNTTGSGSPTVQAVPIPIADGGANNTSYNTSGVIFKNASQLTSTTSGTATQILHGGTTPSFSAVVLTTDVSGLLPVANGGTGVGTLTLNGIIFGNGTSAVGITSAGASNTVLHGNTGAAPTFSAVSLTADVSGVLPIANGGTNNSSALTAGSVIFSNGTSLTQDNTNLFWNDSTDQLYLGGATIGVASTILGANGFAVFNEQGNAVDFRIESNNSANMFVVSGANDSVEIGTGTQGAIAKFSPTEIVFNETGLASLDFRVESDTNANIIFVDASANLVGIGTNVPTSTLHVNGGFAADVVEQTGNYTLTAGDFAINANPSAGTDTTMTLPAASTCAGRIYLISKVNASITDTVTIDGNGAETINGATTIVLTTQFSSRTIISDGTNWFVIGST